jgi:hypothetical protein
VCLRRIKLMIPTFVINTLMLDGNARPLAISLLPSSSSVPRFKSVALAGALSLILCALLLGAVVNRQPQAQAETSKLWGKAGELWTPQSRLPDFSFAGYHCGEVPLPDVPVVNSVTRFGAKGDGSTDDTAAFLKAIEETSNGALFIPEGRYVLTGVLTINKSNLVLRGAGPEKTVLVIPKSLTQLSEPTKGFPFSFSGGFVTVKGETPGEKLAEVTAPAQRGDRQLQLSAALPLKPGDFLRLTMTDNAGTLAHHLHADLADAGGDTYKSLRGKNWVDWAARVEKITGETVVLDRPLRLDVRLEWKPQIHSYRPTVTEVGIENLSFAFAGLPKLRHLQEEGFNAVYFSGVANCWARNLIVNDADLGVMVAGFSRFCSIENVRFNALKRVKETGHHGLWATGGAQDCLFSRFRFDTLYMHDLTVEGRANGNVFRDGSGISLNFDHHRNAPYENLFTNLDVGIPKRIWQSSGRADRGPHSAARATFWNLRGATQNFPPIPDWPQINAIAVPASTSQAIGEEAWIEPFTTIEPPDLYLAQRQRQLSRQSSSRK